MAQEQVANVAKLKKKQWHPIIAPKQFDNVVLGETLVYEPSAMLGKTLSHSLMNLTNDLKRQNINIHFEVIGVEDGKAITRIIGYEIVSSSVKRFIRRNSEKINLSFACETADNVMLRVKPLIVTNAEVKGSVSTHLSNNVVQYLVKTIKKMTYDEFFNDLILHKVQAMMREHLNKIYPLKVCEIRYAGIGTSQKPNEAREKKEEAKAEIKEEQKI